MKKKNEHQYWHSVEEEIKLIEKFSSFLDGYAHYQGKTVGAEIDKVNDKFVFRIDTIFSSRLADNPNFLFQVDGAFFKVSGRTTAHRNSVNVREGWGSRFTEGIIDEIRSEKWLNSDGRFRSYYRTKNEQLLYQVFGNTKNIEITFDSHRLSISQEDNYVLITAIDLIAVEVFNELSYGLLVALGFVSGHFLQDEVFIFRLLMNRTKKAVNFHYRTLRKGGTSIYQALVWNPFGYEQMIGRPYSERLYKNKTLIPLDLPSFLELARQVLYDHHIKYALVLFNDANDRTQSLLVLNNCFFIVLEVLRKTFFEQVRNKLPSNYTNRKHLEKFRMVFDAIAPITDEENELLELRNTFMHGDIRDIEGEEMIQIMHKQISLIYKLVMTHVGFRGHIINHFFLRNGPPNKAFTKLVAGFAEDVK